MSKTPSTRAEIRKQSLKREAEFLKKYPLGSPEYKKRLKEAEENLLWLYRHHIDAGAG